ncbi:unnamed protein product, partial [Didymodactylos carnosus]
LGLGCRIHSDTDILLFRSPLNLYPFSILTKNVPILFLSDWENITLLRYNSGFLFLRPLYLPIIELWTSGLNVNKATFNQPPLQNLLNNDKINISNDIEKLISYQYNRIKAKHPEDNANRRHNSKKKSNGIYAHRPFSRSCIFL